MKKDYKHIIMDTGCTKSYNVKKRNNTTSEDCPKFESTGKYRNFGWDAKVNYPNKVSLKRLLQKNIGRKWDDFYSEFCSNYKISNYNTYELNECLKSCVELNTKIIDGKIYDDKGFSLEGCYTTQIYVHPITKLICQTPKKKHKRLTPKKTFIEENDYIYFIKNGVWYKGIFKPFHYILRSLLPRDIRLDKQITEKECIKIYSKPSYIASKKQINKTQIKKLLKNYSKEIQEML